MEMIQIEKTAAELFSLECLRKVSFGGTKDKTVLRCEAVPVKQGENTVWRITRYLSDGKALHENRKTEEMAATVIGMLEFFSEFHLHAAEGQFDCRVTKKGKILVSDKIKRNVQAKAEEHNRQKQYILDSYLCRDFLHALGVSDEDGTRMVHTPWSDQDMPFDFFHISPSIWGRQTCPQGKSRV